MQRKGNKDLKSGLNNSLVILGTLQILERLGIQYQWEGQYNQEKLLLIQKKLKRFSKEKESRITTNNSFLSFEILLVVY